MPIFLADVCRLDLGILKIVHNTTIKMQGPHTRGLIQPQTRIEPPPFFTIDLRFCFCSCAFFLFHISVFPSDKKNVKFTFIRKYFPFQHFWEVFTWFFNFRIVKPFLPIKFTNKIFWTCYPAMKISNSRRTDINLNFNTEFTNMRI